MDVDLIGALAGLDQVEAAQRRLRHIEGDLEVLRRKARQVARNEAGALRSLGALSRLGWVALYNEFLGTAADLHEVAMNAFRRAQLQRDELTRRRQRLEAERSFLQARVARLPEATHAVTSALWRKERWLREHDRDLGPRLLELAAQHRELSRRVNGLETRLAAWRNAGERHSDISRAICRALTAERNRLATERAALADERRALLLDGVRDPVARALAS
jgi:chromosome segregation ATPase